MLRFDWRTWEADQRLWERMQAEQESKRAQRRRAKPPSPETDAGGRLLAFVLLPVLLVRCVSRSRTLSRWFLAEAVRFIPVDQRDRYYQEWLANIEHLEQYGLPTLGESITVLRAGALIGGRQRSQLAGIRTKQRALRLGPVWVGFLTFLGSFLIALSSLLATSSPTKPQLGTALVGSILLGVLAGGQTHKAKSEHRQGLM